METRTQQIRSVGTRAPEKGPLDIGPLSVGLECRTRGQETGWEHGICEPCWWSGVWDSGPWRDGRHHEIRGPGKLEGNVGKDIWNFKIVE